ncbi:hypothetical protein ACFRAR_28400 [Kitasatospora sp. NPDC056651]|uniref:hypothetical protein n=1 Tax=Kitasatospora sp. NPDC056651 TaxID=3345892 RepID=UPI0036A9C5E5
MAARARRDSVWGISMPDSNWGGIVGSSLGTSTPDTIWGAVDSTWGMDRGQTLGRI